MTVADSDSIKEYPCLFESIKGKDENEMLKFHAKVKKYENFIRQFYLNNPNASEEQFNTEIIEYSRKLQDEIPLTATKSQKYYWQARILYQRPDDSKDQALFLLQKSLKLNAYLVDAWTISSQILWEKQKLQATVNCIKDAYDTEVSPKTLAYMSFVLRLSALNCENKQNKEALLKESITKAKLAVTQKPKYSFALFCLGMSYFYYYFNSENSRDIILEMALKMLQESADEGFLRGDLYINMAEAAIYFQNYSNAIECLEKARKIEPFFCRNKLPNLLEYLSHFASEVAKQKKSLLNRKNAEEIFQSLNEFYDELQLRGRKKDGGMMDEEVSWLSKNPPKRKISEIKETAKNEEERNECFVAVLRVLAQINTNSFSVPKAYVVTDEDCNVAILTIYNVSQSFCLMVNSTVTLYSPIIFDVSSPNDSGEQFQCLRCSNPNETLLRDGKSLELTELQSVGISLNA